jgi:hypothetical protein
MTHSAIKNKYRQLFQQYKTERDRIAKKIKKYGMIRLFFFLFWIIVIGISTGYSWVVLTPVLAAGIIIFAILISVHSKLHKRKEILDQLVHINKQQEKSMDYDYSENEDGSGFIQEDHLFSYDLDIFGKGGLYQYVNRSSTATGKNRLAADLSSVVCSKEFSEGRQEAIAEMANMFEWRQNFRVRGLLVEEQDDDISGLTDWVSLPPDFRSLFFSIILIVVPLINLAMLLLVLFHVITFWHFLAYLVIPLAISGIKHRTVNKKHNLLSRKFHVLKKYSGLFEMIESYTFASSLLKKNREILMLDGESAGRAIRQLAKITNAFDTRLNLLAGFLMNIFFVWDIRQAVRLDRWKERYKDHLPAWFTVMGEVDALVSFAGYAYNNPDFVYPEIVEGEEFQMDAEKLGHPLIDRRNRICNHYQVKGKGKFTILTGANMAGKSTFLRTVGINMLLASNGAPVCAEKMKICPANIVTSIHTADSLANNESYFYAELKRLKLIIDMLQEGKHIFIILDEILKGTNSKDKQSGSKALVEQLISLNASGIIATHDLSLGILQERFPENVENKCFEVIIENDRLDYDYQLKDGIARNMNATILMERMGITVK